MTSPMPRGHAASAPLLRLLLTTVLAPLAGAAEPELSITPLKADGVYQPGEAIVWRVEAPAGTGGEATYVIKTGGLTEVGHGTIQLGAGPATVQAEVKEPCSVLLEVTAKAAAGKKDLHGNGGALVAPAQIAPSLGRPDDFDAFWKGKLDELAAVPANPQLEVQPSEKDGVDYWHITMDNVRGTHIRGQLARPTSGDKLPALLLVQYAGVYGLPKTNVTGYAAQGWLALNILAHDLPIDQPPAFYQQQSEQALKNYTAIGNDDREQSYFLRMYLACSRAVDYLAARPDWNGTVLAVSGTSQGGLQSFVAAGLNPKVTAVMALVPAGCDDTAALAGRVAGWPYWMASATGKDPKKAQETSRYFDAVNFASRITCPTLVGVGLIDLTARPAGVCAAFNQFKGPKELVVLPLSDHHGTHGAQAAFTARAGAWRAALLKGQAPPVK